MQIKGLHSIILKKMIIGLLIFNMAIIIFPGSIEWENSVNETQQYDQFNSILTKNTNYQKNSPNNGELFTSLLVVFSATLTTLAVFSLYGIFTLFEAFRGNSEPSMNLLSFEEQLLISAVIGTIGFIISTIVFSSAGNNNE